MRMRIRRPRPVTAPAAGGNPMRAHGKRPKAAATRPMVAIRMRRLGAAGSIDDNGEADDADQWDGSGDGGVERADLHSTMKRVDGSDHAEHDHDGRKAEGDGAEG